jgi:hypothetical protein
MWGRHCAVGRRLLLPERLKKSCPTAVIQNALTPADTPEPARAVRMKEIPVLVKRLIKAGAACVMLFVLFTDSSVSARGQEVGIFRAPQGRRVGRVRLPTPPFNPDAGVLDGRSRRARDSRKTTARSPRRHRVKGVNGHPRPRTSRRRGGRRGSSFSSQG